MMTTPHKGMFPALHEVVLSPDEINLSTVLWVWPNIWWAPANHKTIFAKSCFFAKIFSQKNFMLYMYIINWGCNILRGSQQFVLIGRKTLFGNTVQHIYREVAQCHVQLQRHHCLRTKTLLSWIIL